MSLSASSSDSYRLVTGAIVVVVSKHSYGEYGFLFPQVVVVEVAVAVVTVVVGGWHSYGCCELV